MLATTAIVEAPIQQGRKLRCGAIVARSHRHNRELASRPVRSHNSCGRARRSFSGMQRSLLAGKDASDDRWSDAAVQLINEVVSLGYAGRLASVWSCTSGQKSSDVYCAKPYRCHLQDRACSRDNARRIESWCERIDVQTSGFVWIARLALPAGVLSGAGDVPDANMSMSVGSVRSATDETTIARALVKLDITRN